MIQFFLEGKKRKLKKKKNNEAKRKWNSNEWEREKIPQTLQAAATLLNKNIASYYTSGIWQRFFFKR